MKALSRCR